MGDIKRLEVKIGDIRMRTPLIAVSGIYGHDYENIVPSLPYIGAVVPKSLTLKPRPTHPPPRIIPIEKEAHTCLLNAIGLGNPGVDEFIKQEIPKLRSLGVPVIASVAGSSTEEYVECSKILSPRDEILGIELNVSCPNVEKGGIEFGCDASLLEPLVSSVKNVISEKTLIVKLTPNVADIAIPAQAAINGGADAISLINTLRGMKIDTETQQPILGNKFGGVSGPIIHEVAVYMVYRCYTSCCKKQNIPIIGIGGVSTDKDAIELILAGAACVGIGTALFRNLDVFEEVAEGINAYIVERGAESVASLVGKAANELSADS